MSTIEQEDIFRPGAAEWSKQTEIIADTITKVVGRIDGAITEGHFLAMTTSALQHEGVTLSEDAKHLIEQEITAAGGWRGVDWHAAAQRIMEKQYT